MTTSPSVPDWKGERVWIIPGIPDPTSPEMIPVTITDPQSRRVRYQKEARNKLAPLHGRSGYGRAVFLNGQWTITHVEPNEEPAL